MTFIKQALLLVALALPLNVMGAALSTAAAGDKDSDPLTESCGNIQKDLTQLLIDVIGKIDVDKQKINFGATYSQGGASKPNIFILAIRIGNPLLFHKLLNDAIEKATDDQKIAYLTAAAEQGNSMMVAQLIAVGCPTNSPNGTAGPLHAACSKVMSTGYAHIGYVETVKLLLTHGALANRTNSDGQTPAQIVQAGKNATVKMIQLALLGAKYQQPANG